MKNAVLFTAWALCCAACSSSSNTPDTTPPAADTAAVVERSIGIDPNAPVYSPKRRYSAQVITIDSLRSTAPDGSNIVEPLQKLVVSDAQNKKVRELLPAQFNNQNIMFVKWVGESDFVFATAALFDISGFMLCRISQNQINPIRYNLSTAIIDSIQPTDRIMWKQTGDTITAYRKGE